MPVTKRVEEEKKADTIITTGYIDVPQRAYACITSVTPASVKGLITTELSSCIVLTLFSKAENTLVMMHLDLNSDQSIIASQINALGHDCTIVMSALSVTQGRPLYNEIQDNLKLYKYTTNLIKGNDIYGLFIDRPNNNTYKINPQKIVTPEDTPNKIQNPEHHLYSTTVKLDNILDAPAQFEKMRKVQAIMTGFDTATLTEEMLPKTHAVPCVYDGEYWLPIDPASLALNPAQYSAAMAQAFNAIKDSNHSLPFIEAQSKIIVDHFLASATQGRNVIRTAPVIENESLKMEIAKQFQVRFLLSQPTMTAVLIYQRNLIESLTEALKNSKSSKKQERLNRWCNAIATKKNVAAIDALFEKKGINIDKSSVFYNVYLKCKNIYKLMMFQYGFLTESVTMQKELLLALKNVVELHKDYIANANRCYKLGRLLYTKDSPELNMIIALQQHATAFKGKGMQVAPEQLVMSIIKLFPTIKPKQAVASLASHAVTFPPASENITSTAAATTTATAPEASVPHPTVPRPNSP